MAALINERHEELTSVEQFLEYARLDKQADGYLELLSRAGLDEIDDVQEADDEMLSTAGMGKQFHRKRFLKLAKQCKFRPVPATGGGKPERADAECDQCEELRAALA